jgi:nucleotide-binding universal stress UspA family protein
MINKILLPLDGSQLAEAAVPYVRNIADRLGCEVYLVHVCPPEHQQYVHMHQIYMNSLVEGLKTQLKTHKDIKIQSEVVVGDPLKTLFDYSRLKNIDLIALTTHGNAGFKPWSLGEVADKIVRGSGIPTLLIRLKDAKDLEPRKTTIDNILAPVDNSDASKAALPLATEMALKMQAKITLFSMAQTAYAQSMDSSGSGLGINWDAVDKASVQATAEYLKSLADEVKKQGIQVNAVSLLGFDAAYEILEQEKKGNFDLVVMATRGRSSIARWAFGSVAEKVLREGNLPILLIKEKGAKEREAAAK